MRTMKVAILATVIVMAWSIQSMAEYTGPELRMPVQIRDSKSHCTVQTGGRTAWGGVDSYHRNNSFYSLDFDNRVVSDPVLAAAAGYVTNRRNENCVIGGDPCYIEIDHGFGYKTKYLHLKEGSIPSNILQLGSLVKAGQIIGVIGNTGASIPMGSGDGTHLHFEIKHNGNGSYSSDPASALWGVKLTDETGPRKWVDYEAGQYYGSNNTLASYTYDNNAETCKGPVIYGSEANDWTYTCQNSITTYSQNEQVYALAHISNVTASHQFKIEIYKNYSKVFEESGPWNNVSGYWHKAHALFTVPIWQTRMK